MCDKCDPHGIGYSYQCICDKESSQVDTLVSLASEKFKEIIKQRESILTAFIAETGLKPSEIEQVEEKTESGVVWYLRQRQG